MIKALKPAELDYEKFSANCSDYQVSVDIFLMPSLQYVDVASLLPLFEATGGQLWMYPQFDAAIDAPKLYNDIRWMLIRPTGLEAVFR